MIKTTTFILVSILIFGNSMSLAQFYVPVQKASQKLVDDNFGEEKSDKGAYIKIFFQSPTTKIDFEKGRTSMNQEHEIHKIMWELWEILADYADITGSRGSNEKECVLMNELIKRFNSLDTTNQHHIKTQYHFEETHFESVKQKILDCKPCKGNYPNAVTNIFRDEYMQGKCNDATKNLRQYESCIGGNAKYANIHKWINAMCGANDAIKVYENFGTNNDLSSDCKNHTSTRQLLKSTSTLSSILDDIVKEKEHYKIQQKDFLPQVGKDLQKILFELSKCFDTLSDLKNAITDTEEFKESSLWGLLNEAKHNLDSFQELLDTKLTKIKGELNNKFKDKFCVKTEKTIKKSGVDLKMTVDFTNLCNKDNQATYKGTHFDEGVWQHQEIDKYVKEFAKYMEDLLKENKIDKKRVKIQVVGKADYVKYTCQEISFFCTVPTNMGKKYYVLDCQNPTLNKTKEITWTTNVWMGNIKTGDGNRNELDYRSCNETLAFCRAFHHAKLFYDICKIDSLELFALDCEKISTQKDPNGTGINRGVEFIITIEDFMQNEYNGLDPLSKSVFYKEMLLRNE